MYRVRLGLLSLWHFKHGLAHAQRVLWSWHGLML